MRFYFIFICLFFFQCFSPSVKAQERYPLLINEVLGKSIKNIYDIKQSRDGFIWISGDEGLSRFDGFFFKSYRNPNMSSTSGSAIQQDKNGNIWYCNFDGEIYVTDKDSLKKADLPLNTGLNFIVKSDTLWMVHNLTLMQYQISTGSIKEISTLPAFRIVIFENDFFQIYDAITKKVLLYHYDGRLKQSFVLNDNDYARILLINGVYYKVSVHSTQIKIQKWVNNQFEQIAKYDINTAISNLVIDKDVIAICTKDGLLRFNVQQQSFEHLLSGISVLNSFKDVSENEWVATNSGIYFFSRLTMARGFQLFGTSFSFHKIGNDLLVSDEKGRIMRINKDMPVTNPVFESRTKQRVYQIFTSPQKQAINALINAQRADLANTFSISNTHYLIMNSGVKSVCRLDDKYVAVAMSGSCDLIKIGNDTSKSVWDQLYNEYPSHSDVSNVSNLIFQVRGKSVMYDSANQRLLFATNQGLKMFNPNQKLELKYEDKPIYADKLIFAEQQFIILSNSGDLYICNEQNEILKIPNISHHLPIVNISTNGSQLLFWNAHNIYIVAIADLKSIQSLEDVKSISSPIVPSEFQDVYFASNYVNIIAGTQFLELKLMPNSNKATQPILKMEQLRTSKRVFYPEQKIVIPNGNTAFEVVFSILDFNHEVYELSYQLNDGEWKSILPSDRSVKFVSISPGNYTLKFKINGTIQEEQLKFEKLKPWYNQWWFYASVFVAIVGIMYAYFSNKIKKQTTENKLLVEKTELENSLRQSLLSSIKSQMNPHFLFNALNTIQSYIITEDKENASRYLSMFSRLTRTILEMSDKEFVSLEFEIRTIKLYVELEQMRFPEIQYSLAVSEGINIHTTHIPSMIIQPFVENAIKHGLLHKQGEKQLAISITNEDNLLKIKIVDNGIGREKSELLNQKRSKQHISFATKANLKRVELLHKNHKDIVWEYQDLKDRFGNPLGTEVILKIPINNIEND